MNLYNRIKKYVAAYGLIMIPSIALIIYHQMVKRLVSNELERIWKAAAVV